MDKRILIIDDDAQMLSSLEMLFLAEAYQGKSIDTECLIKGALESFKPTIILMDIRLDGADGRLICDEIKQDVTTKHIPVILITALSFHEISEMDCLADAIIGKPVTTERLL
ncbi:response regulator [Pedobacter sp. MC2016-05]|uniref:response regulator n=1 Tax=Pedobacter sp. MC2016-05 TaxID=2994474 RepID=UPI00224822E0|nr:response regulator [Pedobacter sp. MC2016-05]MCX2475306.1 response regulator [Pedobacter sp. MC2016-05]